MSHRVAVRLLLAGFASVTLMSACGRMVSTSRVDTVNLPQTNPKNQSIGNCWAYAFASWIESIALRDKKITLDISESYITYRHFENQLHMASTKSVDTGGAWPFAKGIVEKYGVMSEGDFIPSEANSTYSSRQSSAVYTLNSSLSSGALSRSRDDATIRAELDRAFGVNLASVSSKIVDADKFMVSVDENGADVSIKTLLDDWEEVMFDYDFDHAPRTRAELPKQPEYVSGTRERMLKRVKAALNAHEPVILSWFVDTGARDWSGIFSLETLKKNGRGSQGGHLVVIEDYTVEGTVYETGEHFTIGEGEATAEQKAMAVEYGDITSFIVKNSWGSTGYTRDGESGYHILKASYLFSWIDGGERSGPYPGTQVLSGFVLPRKY